MVELTGQYNSCKIFTDNIDSTTISQIINILNQPQFKDSKIRERSKNILTERRTAFIPIAKAMGFQAT